MTGKVGDIPFAAQRRSKRKIEKLKSIRAVEGLMFCFDSVTLFLVAGV